MMSHQWLCTMLRPSGVPAQLAHDYAAVMELLPCGVLWQATTMEIISTLKELLHMHPLYNEQMRNFIQVGCVCGGGALVKVLLAKTAFAVAVPLRFGWEQARAHSQCSPNSDFYDLSRPSFVFPISCHY